MKKLLVLALAGILGMAILGVGYAMWSSTLTINGTVHTGTVDVEFSGPIVEELGAGELAKPFVADCFAQNLGDILTIDVTNAYPSYECLVTFDVHSIGTIPVHVHQPVAGAANPAWVQLVNCYPQDIQLHQSDQALCSISIHFTNADNVPQGGNVSFDFSILAHQFNEEP